MSKWGNIVLSMVGVAQLVRVSHCGCEGWGFESPRSPCYNLKLKFDTLYGKFEPTRGLILIGIILV